MTAARGLVVILGPTASGKSALAIHLAHGFSGEIVCCDSTQVYRYFDIGTAKVREEERQGIPHHLMDLVEPQGVFTAGDYRRHAVRILEEISSRARLPILTAGTGLYLRGLLEGLSEAPQRSEAMRARLNLLVSKHGPDYLHRVLARLDPQAAGRIAVRDVHKAIRAIEVCLLAGEPLSAVHSRGKVALRDFEVLKIGLRPERKALYERINRRVLAMFDAGWLGEVRELRQRGIPITAKPFSFIGYQELAECLEGRSSLDECAEKIRQATRRYAKRQITWFARERDVHWLAGFGEDLQVRQGAGRLVSTACKAQHTAPY